MQGSQEQRRGRTLRSLSFIQHTYCAFIKLHTQTINSSMYAYNYTKPQHDTTQHHTTRHNTMHTTQPITQYFTPTIHNFTAM